MLLVMIGCITFLQADLATAAPIHAAPVTEFPLPSNDFLPGAITPAPDGNLWFANRSGPVGKPVSGQIPVDGINRITPAGAVTEFPLPARAWQRQVSGLAVGADGNVWFADGTNHVGYITMAGEITEFDTDLQPRDITSGKEGNLWFTQVGEVPVRGGVGRVTPAGQIISFPLPEPGSFPGAITTGAEGNLWFVVHREGSPGIGRLTPEGQFTIFSLSTGGLSPAGITLGPDGNAWFTRALGKESSSIGRITPGGQISEYRLPKEKGRWPGGIAAGPDGRLWFTYGWGEIGRVTPRGRFSFVSVPHGDPRALTSGPEESVWYTADTEASCGGGGDCQAVVPTPGVVGRFTPGPLVVEIGDEHVNSRGRWLRIKLTCREGDAADVCRGNVRLRVRVPRRSGHGMQSLVLARRSYVLPVDTGRKIALRLRSGVEDLLPRHRSKADVIATNRGGRAGKIKISVTP